MSQRDRAVFASLFLSTRSTSAVLAALRRRRVPSSPPVPQPRRSLPALSTAHRRTAGQRRSEDRDWERSRAEQKWVADPRLRCGAMGAHSAGRTARCEHSTAVRGLQNHSATRVLHPNWPKRPANISRSRGPSEVHTGDLERALDVQRGAMLSGPPSLTVPLLAKKRSASASASPPSFPSSTTAPLAPPQSEQWVSSASNERSPTLQQAATGAVAARTTSDQRGARRGG